MAARTVREFICDYCGYMEFGGQNDQGGCNELL